MSKLIDQLKRHEGLKLKPYLCTARKLSIGYGLNLDAGISEGLADLILKYQVGVVEKHLMKMWCFNQLDEVRQNVLINMAFNLGISGLLKFSKMIYEVGQGDYNQAAKEMMDSKWAKQVGNRAVELSEQMRSGKYA
jgi:lysozyme